MSTKLDEPGITFSEYPTPSSKEVLSGDKEASHPLKKEGKISSSIGQMFRGALNSLTSGSTIKNFLKNHEAFAGIEEEELATIANSCKVVSFPAKTQLIKKGETGDNAFLIMSGEVDIPLTNPKGQVRGTVNLKSGDVFGEMSLMSGEPRQEDVWSKTGLKVLEINSNLFWYVFKNVPAAARFFTKKFARRLAEGRRQVGKYIIIEEIGAGGTSFVFRGEHETLKKKVAMKALSHVYARSEEWIERFLKEAKRTAGTLKHPNIIEVFDIEEAFGTHFVMMEHFEYGSLDDWLDYFSVKKRLPQVEHCYKILIQVADALAYAHQQGLVHCDIKPGNVLLNPDRLSVKVTDFGMAFPLGGMPDGRSIMGTPAYISPEQIRCERIDGRADMYSFAIMAYKLLTGQLPFSGRNYYELFDAHQFAPLKPAKEIRPDIPDPLNHLINKATQKDPNERFTDMDEVCSLLNSYSYLIDKDRYKKVERNMAVVSLIKDQELSPKNEEKVNEVMAWFREKMQPLGFEVYETASFKKDND